MEEIRCSVINHGNSGTCSACGEWSDDLFTIELSNTGRIKQMILCRECSKKLYLKVKKKNESALNDANANGNKKDGYSSPPAGKSYYSQAANETDMNSYSGENIRSERKYDRQADNKESKAGGFYTVAILFILLAVIAGIVFLSCMQVLNYGDISLGYSSYEKAVKAYVTSAYCDFSSSGVLAKMNKDILNGMCEYNGITREEADAKLAGILGENRDSIMSYTFSTSPKANYIIDGTESAKLDLPEMNGRFYLFGYDGKVNDLIWVDIDMYYLLSPGLSEPEATDTLLIAQLGKRWYIVDSDLISEVFNTAFD